MNKIRRRLLAFLLAFCLVLSSPIIAHASSFTSTSLLRESEVIDAIQENLSFVYKNKEMSGIPEGKFHNLSVGSAIPAYEYVDGKFVQIDLWYYPVFSSKELFGFSLVSRVKDKTIAQFESWFADNVKSVNHADSIAFVFDSETLYVYTSTGFVKIYSFSLPSQKVQWRDSLRDNSPSRLAVSGIRTTSTFSAFSTEKALSIDYTRDNHEYTGYMIVEPVLQYEHDICWAASVASIGNTITSLEYSAEDIARAVFNDDFNHGTSSATAISALNDIYDLNYTLSIGNLAPNAEISLGLRRPVYVNSIYPNVDLDTPVQVPPHALVLFSIDVDSDHSGSFALMDPQGGPSSNPLYCYKYGIAVEGTYYYNDNNGLQRILTEFGFVYEL